ncbi:MAG: DUF255 domain-containing protein [Catenulispora sp.]|nr:DUF255 domain-containing protein [Catenulispora sp.]
MCQHRPGVHKRGAGWRESIGYDVPLCISIGYAACHWCHLMR